MESTVIVECFARMAEENDLLSFGDLIRLARVSRTLRFLMVGSHGLMYEAIRFARMPCRLHRVKGNGARDEDVFVVHRGQTYASLCASGWRRGQLVTLNGRTYEAVCPSIAAARKHVCTKVCRECLYPTTAAALTTTSMRVLLCVGCSKDPQSYSALCGRHDIWAYNNDSRRKWHLKARALDAKIATFTRARIGGNRAHLFWRHQALTF